MTLLGAIGDITRFPSAQKLVGYAGLGAQVHDSGQKRWSGGITKSGRRDLRRVMVDAARHAVKAHGHWKQQFARLEPRIGRPKALVAIARKLLVAVWHILSKEGQRHAAQAVDKGGMYDSRNGVQVARYSLRCPRKVGF